MATAEQIKSLIRSFTSDDEDRFYTTALQLAAHEAELGHGPLAHEIRDLVDKARRSKKAVVLEFPADLSGLVFTETTEAAFSSLVLPSELLAKIKRIAHEYRQREKLRTHSLSHRRKILMTGPPGTGKTLTARVLAYELKLQLRTVQVDKLVTKFMGETSAKLRQIFELIQKNSAVYFFDEFDAIGGGRTLENDVGEMRRVLNAFLQFIEADRSESIILAATNSPQLLDRALFRRFDDVLQYALPTEEERRVLIENVLGARIPKIQSWKNVLSASDGLSHAEVDVACRDALKHAVLHDEKTVSAKTLKASLVERFRTHVR